MKNIDTYLTKDIPDYKVIYHFPKNNIFYSSSYQKHKTKNLSESYYSPVKTENPNFDSENKKRLNNIYFSYNQNVSTINSNIANNSYSNMYYTKEKKSFFKNSFNNSNNNSKTNSSNIDKNKYKNISRISNNNKHLNIIPIIPNSKNKIIYEPKRILEDKSKKARNLSFIKMSNTNTTKLNDSFKKNNHSFFEVKSLTKDYDIPKKKNFIIKIKNKNSEINNLNRLNNDKNKELKTNKISNNIFDKKNEKKVVNINYNINNNIKLIIKSKNIKYIPKGNKIIINKNKINLKNIASTKFNKNTKRCELTANKINKYKLNIINSYFFSYLPKSKIEENKTKIKKKKKKKINNENKLLLKNLNCKTFSEDFPIKVKYNRNYRTNKTLKPQISFRLTLFKQTKEEEERYFIINSFFSDNLKIPDNINQSEFFF